MNGLQHGLRSCNPLALIANTKLDPAWVQAALVEVTAAFPPESELETSLIRLAAETSALLRAVRRLWRDVFRKEMDRIAAETPHRDILTLDSLAFRSLANHTSFIPICRALESRVNRQFKNAIMQLDSIQYARVRAAQRRSRKVSAPRAVGFTALCIAEGIRTPQVNPSQAVLDDRTSELFENAMAKPLGITSNPGTRADQTTTIRTTRATHNCQTKPGRLSDRARRHSVSMWRSGKIVAASGLDP